MKSVFLSVVAGFALLTACGHEADIPVTEGYGPSPTLPAPVQSLIPTLKPAEAVGWPAGAKPRAAEGLSVALLAEGLDHPRWIYVLPNGDILVAETNAQPKSGGGLKAMVMAKVQKYAGAGVPSADRITLLRDSDGDGVVDMRRIFLGGLRSPFGMALVGDAFYVANTAAVLKFSYQAGDLAIKGAGETVVELPAGPINHHWTKNILASPDGRHLYVTVGSNSNVGNNGMEAEKGRAAIWEVDLSTGAHRVFASGLRNPNGMAWEPQGGALWTVVNERDEIGSDLVPDYLTSVEDGGFYGWPYSYFGTHIDKRVKPQMPDLVARAIVPDYALGPHTASLGLAFSPGNAALGSRFLDGAFVGQHGSWNRAPRSGYKVVFIRFSDGHPTGAPTDVLTGFLNEDGEARGRPVGVAFDKHGALLVADDVGNRIWRVTATPQDRRPLLPRR